MSVNKAILVGNMGDDIKITKFENGNCVGTFPLATNESYVDKQSGEKVTKTDWHNIVVRNRTAEVLAQYTGKGDQIYLEGMIRTRNYQAQDGQTRYTTEIHVHSFTFLNNKQ